MNPKQAYGEKKPQLHLIPAVALIEEAVALKSGADKYGVNNWHEIGVKSSTYISAAMRHLLCWASGEDNDPDSGASHLAHVRACMAIVLDCEYLGNLEDDRPEKSGSAAYAIRTFTNKDNVVPLHQPSQHVAMACGLEG